MTTAVNSLSDYLDQLEVKDDTQYEVAKVIDHRVNDGKWEFKLQFKGYEDSDYWTKAEDCFCDELVSAYLKTKGHKTVYVFARVSTKPQTTGVSLEVQINTAVQKADEIYGGTCYVKVVSLSVSAYKGVPKELIRVANMCNENDSIFCYRVDRLSRNIVEYMALLEDLRKRGVLIYSVDENIWYNENQLHFLECILNAQKESHLIGKRVRSSIKFRRQRGDKTLGSAPYGKSTYRDSFGRLMLKRNEEEENIIRRILESDQRPNELANTLNALGLLKRGKKWTSAMIRYTKMSGGNVILL